MNTNTDYSKKIEILNDVFINHRDEERFVEFADFNDVGLPLAHAIYAGIVESTPRAQEAIEESYGLLLALFNIDEDTGFDNLEGISSA